MESIKTLFPNFPNDLLEEKYNSFYTQLKFIDQVNKDLNSYLIAFPNLTPALIKSYYIDFLSHLEATNKSLFFFNAFHTLPFNILLSIFKYLDIFDLIKFTHTNSDIYKYIHSFPFFANRIKWELEHDNWISKKLVINDFQNLIYTSSNPIEQCYKNHIILKRNLIRIDPLNSNDKEIIDRYRNLTPFKAFNKFFHKNFGQKCSGKQFFSICSQFYKELSPDQLLKYEHASSVAKRYGFIFCFRSLKWWFNDDFAINNPTDLSHMIFDENIYTKLNVEFIKPPPTLTLKKKIKSISNPSIHSSTPILNNSIHNDSTSNSISSKFNNSNDDLNMDVALINNIETNRKQHNRVVVFNHDEDYILKVNPMDVSIHDTNIDYDVNTENFLNNDIDEDDCEFNR